MNNRIPPTITDHLRECLTLIETHGQNADIFEIEQHLDAVLNMPQIESDTEGIKLIAIERERQIHVEGWTLRHDDTHTTNELAQAAACYAWPPPRPVDVKRAYPSGWEWKPVAYDTGKGYDPYHRIRELVKAGALIAAEIDRLLRTVVR